VLFRSSLAADGCSDPLFEFYMALRAMTQAKVAIWHLDDPDHRADAAHWRGRALAALHGARRHCRPAASDTPAAT